MISVLSWTAYWLFSKRARVSVGALEYMASVMTVAAILMTALALVSGAGLDRRLERHGLGLDLAS